MSLPEDLLQMVVGDEASAYSGSFLQNLSNSMSNVACGSDDEELERCRDDSYALILKLIAIALILISGVCGVAIPLIGKKHRYLRTDSNLFVASKAFAAGVILATGFVHMLSDATSALSNPCLPKIPWSKFPFPGFIAMLSALATLLADFVGTQYYERRQERPNHLQFVAEADDDDDPLLSVSHGGNGIVPVDEAKVISEEEGIARMCHSDLQGHGACHERGDDTHLHSHGIGLGDEDGSVRHIVVSQVLELGIVSHSVIIGLSLGVSHSPCTVRPLIGALSFHQFFEGFALGGCISQARFKTLRSTVMACFFALTTPVGIGMGIGLSSIYDANSPRALVIEGIFDSISAGILVYMALVDLIAADFLSKRMSCDFKLQVASYFALLFGALLMSGLAIWA